MTRAFEKRLAIVWLILSGITIIQYLGLQFGEYGVFQANTALTASVILVSLIKVRIILKEFMEVRHAPPLLNRLTDVWLLVTAAALLGTYIVGMRLATQ